MEMIWVEGLPDELLQRAREAVVESRRAERAFNLRPHDPETAADALCASAECQRVTALCKEFLGVEDIDG